MPPGPGWGEREVHREGAAMDAKSQSPEAMALEVLDLVGATASYLRWPFVLEAVMQALLAAGLASLMVWGLLRILEAPAELPLGLDLSQLMGFPWQVAPALVALAVLAGVLGGLLGVGRVLRPQGLA